MTLSDCELVFRSVSPGILYENIFHDSVIESGRPFRPGKAMHLLVNGLSLPVAQMGPDFILLDSPINHPPTAASMVLQVDQKERRWNIHLPNGISAKSNRVEIATAT